MRIPARALKYCTVALGVAALAGAALLLAPSRSSAHGGGYLDFTGPGSGYLEVPDNAALNPASAITVEAWIYLNSYAGWGTHPDFTDCPMLAGKNWQSAYALALGCGGDVMDSFINAHEHFTDAATIPLHTWTHVAMTWDGVTRKNFQDGVQIFSLAESDGSIGDTADPLRIGSDVEWDRSPDGRIDDVRIWNIARTQAEIQAGMNGVAATAPGLVADWTFDNGSLTDAASSLTGALAGDVHLAGDNATPTATPNPSLPEFSPGDEDCNNQITINDVSISLHRLAFPPTLPACRTDVDDANCDGTFDAQDPLAILYQLVGLASLPQSCSAATPTPTLTPTSHGSTTPSPAPTQTFVTVNLGFCWIPVIADGTVNGFLSSVECTASGETSYGCATIGSFANCDTSDQGAPDYSCDVIGFFTTCNTSSVGLPDYSCDTIGSFVTCDTSSFNYPDYSCNVIGTFISCTSSSFDWPDSSCSRIASSYFC